MHDLPVLLVSLVCPVLLVSLVCPVLFCSCPWFARSCSVRAERDRIDLGCGHGWCRSWSSSTIRRDTGRLGCPVPGLMTVSISVEDYDRLAVDVRSIMSLDGDLIEGESSDGCSALFIGHVLGM